jgi:two-component sensor histidine kinase
MSMAGMHVVSEATVTVACFSAAFAVLWYLLNRRGLSSENTRAGYLLFACFLGCGLSRLVDLTAMSYPQYWFLDYIDAFLVSASLVSGIAVWPLLPELAKLPSASDLQKANRKLAAQERARGILLERLTDANRELERRVAERTSALLTANRRFEAALNGSNISVSQQDRDLKYTWTYNLPGAPSSDKVIGTHSVDWLPAPDAAVLDAEKQRAIASGETIQFEFSTRIGGELRWFEERVEPTFDEGAVVGVISTAVEVTARKKHELELVELLRELTHRSKNLLAVVAGIARQTGQSASSIADFHEHFGSRLQALSLAHELLVKNLWRGVDLRMLIAGVLANVAPRDADAISLEGPSVTLGPEVAQTLAIGLHEMATNAIRHGGLAAPDGALSVAWDIERAGDQRRLTFAWREKSVAPPSRSERGFGLSFVDTLLPRALDGRSKVAFDDGAMIWTMTFPLPANAA